jgi:hypothetical protein
VQPLNNAIELNLVTTFAVFVAPRSTHSLSMARQSGGSNFASFNRGPDKRQQAKEVRSFAKQRHTTNVKHELSANALRKKELEKGAKAKVKRNLLRKLNKELEGRERRRLFKKLYGHLDFSVWFNLDELHDLMRHAFNALCYTCGFCFLCFFIVATCMGLRLVATASLNSLYYMIAGYWWLYPCYLLLYTVWKYAAKIWETVKFARQRQVLSSASCNGTCAICLDDFVGSAEVTTKTLVCGHKFHSCCVTPWLQANHNCPLCRQEVS